MQRGDRRVGEATTRRLSAGSDSRATRHRRFGDAAAGTRFDAPCPPSCPDQSPLRNGRGGDRLGLALLTVAEYSQERSKTEGAG